MSELTLLQRALRILNRLSIVGSTTVNELYEYFERRESKRSIQRALDSIRNAHIPLAVRKGAHNEHRYYLKRAFDYIPSILEPDEVFAAIVLSQFLHIFEGSRISQDIHTVMDKIKHLIPEDNLAVLADWRNRNDVFHFHQSGAVDLHPHESKLKTLYNALLSNLECNVRYKGLGKQKARTFQVQPYSLIFKDGLVYVVVYHHYLGKWVYLSLQRIEDVDVSDQEFARDPEFKLSKFIEHNFGLFNLAPEDITIHFSPKVAPLIEERHWHSTQKVSRHNDGSLSLTIHVGPTEELIAWIMKWGPNAEVLSPDSFRIQVAERLQESLKAYL